MQLLCFAHRGECLAWLRQLDLRPLPLSFATAWQGKGVYVLLTGEGLEQASRTLAAFCARYEEKISTIVNLGIAGGLTAQLAQGEIYQVRTIYAAKYAHQVEYQSYSTSDVNALHDCISARTRVLDAQASTALANFAALVDRELWGMAAVAAQFKLPLRAAKLVSEIVFDAEICQRARAQREQYSAALYAFWQKNLSSMPPPPHEPMTACLAELRQRGFYFTKALQDKVVTLLSSLALRHNWQTNEIIANLAKQIAMEKILKNSPLPKQRTKLLVHQLQALHDPFRVQFNQQLATITAPLRQVAKVSHHEDFANNDIIISSTIKNTDDLKALQQALANFDYQHYHNLLNGIDTTRPQNPKP